MNNEYTNQQIQDFIKPCAYKPGELYSDKGLRSNVYIGKDNKNNKCFMIKIQYDQLSVQLLENITKISQLNFPSLINFISLSKINNDYYLVYDYFNGLQISDYISKAIPNGSKRLMFFINISKFLNFLNKHQMIVDDFLLDFVFVESFETSNIKILYSYGQINNNQANKDENNKTEIIKDNYFQVLAQFIYIISQFNKENDKENFTMFFDQFKDELKNKIKDVFSKVINKHKERNSNEYSFESFYLEIKIIYNELGVLNKNKKHKAIKRVIPTNKYSLIDLPKCTNQTSSDNEPDSKKKDSQELKDTKVNLNECDNQKCKVGLDIKDNLKLNDIEIEESNLRKIKSNSDIDNENKNITNLCLFNDKTNPNIIMPFTTQSQLDINDLSKINRLTSPFQNYHLWLNQTLNRLNTLDQILMTQIKNVNTIWGTIQLSHSQFLNQFNINIHDINK